MAVHGHRGARACRPENTIAAFEYAIDAGADAIELDVVVTSDGVPVVAHDPVAPLSLAELKQRSPDVPTLRAVLELATRGGFLFNIELKPFSDDGYLAGLADKMTSHLPGRVVFQSFDFAILHALARLAPHTPRGALFEEGVDFVAMAGSARSDFVSPEYHLVTAERVQAAHDAGLNVLTWTPNHPLEWKVLIAAGVDGLITDDPAALLRYLRRT